MARLNVNRFPIENLDAEITQLFGHSYTGYTQTGVQVKVNGTQNVYAMIKVVILETGNASGHYNNYVIMQDVNSNICFLYANLYQINVSVGQTINAHSVIGTTTSAGYLTLEIQNVDPNVGWFWSNNTIYYINPSTWIPYSSNAQVGDTIYYSYTPPTPPDPPTPPTPTPIKKSKFPWVLYARKLRSKY